MIEKEELAPFLSVLLIEDLTPLSPHDIHNLLIESINKYPVLEQSNNTLSEFNFAVNGFGFYTTYQVEKRPSWVNKSNVTSDSPIVDIENHIIISMKFGNYWAFFASESGRKEFIRHLFIDNRKTDEQLSPISINKLQTLFINEDDVKVLWLSDIRGKYSHVPSSKVISGSDLADKLNPILDQSYMMSATRTKVQIQESTMSFGVSPFKSVIWSSNCDSWGKFEDKIIQILDYINNYESKEENRPISILAYPIPKLSELKDIYELSFISKDTLNRETELKKYNLLENIEDNFSVEVESVRSNQSFILTARYQGKQCAEYKITYSIRDYKISYKCEPTIKHMKKESDMFEKVFKYEDLIKCWFNPNHALIGGMAFKTVLRSVKFSNFIWDKYESDYSLIDEKPINKKTYNPNLSKIGIEKSLFCWVKNHWSGKWSNNIEGDADFFKTTDTPSGLLICDDGAGELADFIHLDEYKGIKYLSYIHVKAANNDSENRDISVGAHDIVVSQALKNLMRCDRSSFLNIMRERDKGKSVKQCWKSGKLISFNEFETKASAFLKDNKNIQVRVIIVQPHTLKTKFESKSDSNRGMQLNTLLVAADNAIRATGADFFIIGYDA